MFEHTYVYVYIHRYTHTYTRTHTHIYIYIYSTPNDPEPLHFFAGTYNVFEKRVNMSIADIKLTKST